MKMNFTNSKNSKSFATANELWLDSQLIFFAFFQYLCTPKSFTVYHLLSHGQALKLQIANRKS